MPNKTMKYGRFIAAGATPEARFRNWEAWSSGYGNGAAISVSTSKLDGDFTAMVETLSVGDIVLSNRNVGPSRGSYRAVGGGPDYLRVQLFHRAGHYVGNWGDGGVTVSSGSIYLFNKVSGSWITRSGYESSCVWIPRALLDVDDETLQRFSGRELPLDNPMVSGVLRPLLAGMLGRLSVLGEIPNGAVLRDGWIFAIDAVLGSLASSGLGDVRKDRSE
ncbi:MAG TPA: hypothetical protein VN108_08865, partial [Marmoricola sp.]|nr:hypothetical protein [Marmoricola sp.]